jgi:hypothetical protein
MNDIELLANLAEILGGVAVILGIGFGLLEYRRHRADERRKATAILTRSFQTRDISNAIRLMMELPEALDRASYEKLSVEDKNLIWILFGSFESIGILVHRGDLSLDLVDDFFSIPVIEGWRKLLPLVEELRRVHGSQTWEWYQWLHDKMSARHQSQGRIPAHVRYAEGKKV